LYFVRFTPAVKVDNSLAPLSGLSPEGLCNCIYVAERQVAVAAKKIINREFQPVPDRRPSTEFMRYVWNSVSAKASPAGVQYEIQKIQQTKLMKEGLEK